MNSLEASRKRRAGFGARCGATALPVMAVALAFLSCGDEPSAPPPGPGDLVVSLISPNGAEGAALFETTDAGIVGVTAEGGEAYHFQAGGTGRVVVILEVPGEVRFTMNVAERSRPPELSVVEVADGNNRLRGDTSGYTVALSW